MSRDVKLPELGENVQKAEIIAVLVSPGDRVEKDQPILEIETDKATVEVPAEFEGTVKEVLVKPGDTAKVGQTVVRLDDGAPREAPKAREEPPAREEPREAEPARPREAPRKSAQTVHEVKLPELGEGTAKATVLNVLVSPGDRVEKDQAILEIETDKATVEVPCEVAGEVVEVLARAGDAVKVGQAVLRVRGEAGDGARAERPAAPEKAPPSRAAEPDRPAGPDRREDTNGKAGKPPKEWAPRSIPTVDESRKVVPAAPSVRRVARELGVDVAEVEGTGPRGRISIDDVKAHVRKTVKELSARPAARSLDVEAPEMPDFSKWGPVESEPMSGVRRATARQMGRAWMQIPHVTQHDLADVTELEILRQRHADRVKKAGGKLTLTAILLKVLASALKTFPQFNASLDMAGEAVIFKKYFHIGVAVDTERGLLVPVIRDVDKKNILDLAVELNDIAEKARNRKIRPEDLQGGCITITNLGGIGGTAFTPIVNWPEVAILGVTRNRVEPVWSDGQFQPRTMLPLSLSYDHRLIDGADAARFLRWVCGSLENPFQLLLEG